MARESAVLGDYDAAIDQYKAIFSLVAKYTARYESARATGGYAAQTTSSVKKLSAKAGGDAIDAFLSDKWSVFKKDLKSEYDLIVEVHARLG